MNQDLQLSETEIKMFEEIFEVMSKYENNRTFGLQLVHSHFSIGDDEILYETHNTISRELLTRPIKKGEMLEALATSWIINKEGAITVASLCCDDDPPDYPDHPE